MMSPEELSMKGVRHLPDENDPDSVARFREYLRSRGLELDLSSVQSSDV